MRIPLVGGSYQESSRPFDYQRSINLYPVVDKEGKDGAALYGTPGLLTFATAGSGPIRGELSAANGRAFVVSGLSLYELDSAGTATNRGSLDTSSGIVTLADNGFQLAICDGTSLYILTYATNAFAKVTDVDLPICGAVTFLDGYFIVNEVDTGKFYISALYDGLTWAALDFASAESSPDKLVIAANFIGQLGLFGEGTLEIWRNTGDATFPFQRITGSTPIGTKSPYTVTNLDTSIFWVGNSSQGTGIVYKAQGFSPVRISTHPIERILQAVATPANLRAFTYQQDGHVFYCITGAELETTLCYDLSTGIWHERAFLSSAGLSPHLASSCMFAFGKHLVGSRIDGKVYHMSPDYFDDDGDEIFRRRIFTHLLDENQRIRFSRLEVGFETGVGPAEATPIISDDAQEIIDAMTAAPTTARQLLINETVNRLQSAGIWDKLDILTVLRAHHSQAGRINWKDPSQVFTEHGTLTFTADLGYTGDGSTGYLRGITNMNALTNYVLDSAHIGLWSLTDASNNNYYDLGVDTGNNAVRLNTRNAAGSSTGHINSAGAATHAVDDSLGHFILNRTAAGATEMFRNGVSIGTDTDASGSIPAAPLTIFANRPNSSGTFSARQIAVVHAGSQLTTAEALEFYDIMGDYFAGLNNSEPVEPLVSLRLSKDGARTWSDSYTTSLGYQGDYDARCVWRRLGIAQQMTFEITVTAPVKVAMSGAWLN